MTVVVPQLRRGENSLLLWNREELNVAVHTFYGHSDVILEFQWRKIEGKTERKLCSYVYTLKAEITYSFMNCWYVRLWCIADNSYQLVTWSKDQSLRLWHIEPMLLKV